MKEADAAAEKQRRRRSSRTALTTKEPWGTTLLFRSVPDDRYNIYDWQIAMKPLLAAGPLNEYENGPSSPKSHETFPSFTNPFVPQERRIGSSSISRPEPPQRISHKAVSKYPHLAGDSPYAMISPSPSLRSRRSDLSSQSSFVPSYTGFTSSQPQMYATTLPSDLPSPASTSGYDTQFIEGWTSAQGRSSALSWHTRGSNSIASAVTSGVQIASTPPGPQETILDRAFQMRCIPGSERGEDEKISSIARFEALMREADERKRQKSNSSIHDPTQNTSWTLDEDTNESSGEEGDEEDGEDELEMSDQDTEPSTRAQRAIEHFSGHRTPLASHRPLSPTPRSPSIPVLNPQAMSSFHGHSSPSNTYGALRPRTGNGTTIARHNRNSGPNSLALPSRSISATTIPSLKDTSSTNSGNSDLKEKRRSSVSGQRLSFHEFAKRLSSTSSLLLVQTNTNASSNSGLEDTRRGSSEYGSEGDERESRTSFNSKAGTITGTGARDKRCGWRGSVGVFGGEGGFL